MWRERVREDVRTSYSLIVTPFFCIDVQMVKEQLDVPTHVTYAFEAVSPWSE